MTTEEHRAKRRAYDAEYRKTEAYRRAHAAYAEKHRRFKDASKCSLKEVSCIKCGAVAERTNAIATGDWLVSIPAFGPRRGACGECR